MPPIPYAEGLHLLTPGTYAYLQPPGSWGQSNGDLVTAAGQAILVDTPWTLGQTRQLLDAVDRNLPGTCITAVVNTHPNGDHCWGNQLFVSDGDLPDRQPAQRHRHTLQIISAAEASGQTRMVEMNRQVADNLGKIITALEADDDLGQVADAG